MATSFLPRIGTFLFVDGWDIDHNLGRYVLGRKPTSWDRPVWSTVLSFTQERFGGVTPFFYLDGDFFGPQAFELYRSLQLMSYNVHTPSTPPGLLRVDPVVDSICRSIDVLPATYRGLTNQLVVVTHRYYYSGAIQRFLDRGGMATVVGFTELFPEQLEGLTSAGALLLDLEYDVRAFRYRLPRGEA